MNTKSKIFSAAGLFAAAGTLIVVGCTHNSQCCEDTASAVTGETVMIEERLADRAVLASAGLSERASPYEYVHDEQFGTYMDTSKPRRMESAVAGAGNSHEERMRTDIYGNKFVDHPDNYEYVYVEQLGVYLDAKQPSRLARIRTTDTNLTPPRDVASDTPRDISRDSGIPASGHAKAQETMANDDAPLVFTPIARDDESASKDLTAAQERTLVASEPKETLQSLISNWSDQQQMLIGKLSDKYGPPTEISASAVTWKGNGDYLCIKVMKDSASHHFPTQHQDCLTHTIAFKVPTDMADDLLAFNGSLIIDRTRGTLTACCDSEELNILTLNLANDIVNRSRSVDEARSSMAQTALALKSGMQEPYTTKLQFETERENTADPDSASDSTSANAYPNR